MANWCHPKYSFSGDWRIPYPKKDWHEEMRWNAFLLDAMIHALTADAVFSTSGENWGEAEISFFRKHIDSLDEIEYERKAIKSNG